MLKNPATKLLPSTEYLSIEKFGLLKNICRNGMLMNIIQKIDHLLDLM